jgi:hypothetical protein
MTNEDVVEVLPSSPEPLIMARSRRLQVRDPSPHCPVVATDMFSAASAAFCTEDLQFLPSPVEAKPTYTRRPQ